MLGSHHLLLLITQRRKPAEESYKCIVEEKLNRNYDRQYDVERQVEFSI